MCVTGWALVKFRSAPSLRGIYAGPAPSRAGHSTDGALNRDGCTPLNRLVSDTA